MRSWEGGAFGSGAVGATGPGEEGWAVMRPLGKERGTALFFFSGCTRLKNTNVVGITTAEGKERENEETRLSEAVLYFALLLFAQDGEDEKKGKSEDEGETERPETRRGMTEQKRAKKK